MQSEPKFSQEAIGVFGAALTGVVGSRAGASSPTSRAGGD